MRRGVFPAQPSDFGGPYSPVITGISVDSSDSSTNDTTVYDESPVVFQKNGYRPENLLVFIGYVHESSRVSPLQSVGTVSRDTPAILYRRLLHRRSGTK